MSLRERAERLTAASRPAVENLVVLDRVDSTHACALRLIEQAENEQLTLPPTLVVARRQDLGVGRLGRQWQSPAGGLYLSWLAANLEASTVASLPMIAAAATWTAIDRLGVPGATIKWPNDILVAGRKLAGILIHVRHGETTWAAVGVGINLELVPDDVDGGPTLPTAVAEHLPKNGRGDWETALIRVLLAELENAIAEPGPGIALWRAQLGHRIGDDITVQLANGDEVRGRFAGATDHGHLRLEVGGAERVIPTGDVIES